MKKKSILLFENALFWVDNRELITKCLRKVYQKRIKTGKGILKKTFCFRKKIIHGVVLFLFVYCMKKMIF